MREPSLPPPPPPLSSGIIQYGDLEFFLNELHLGQYIHPLREQGTTFIDLLDVTDEGLIKVCVCVRVYMCACIVTQTFLLFLSHVFSRSFFPSPHCLHFVFSISLLPPPPLPPSSTPSLLLSPLLSLPLLPPPPFLPPAQLGITEERARRAILEGVVAIHKKKWHMPPDPIPVHVTLK